MKKKAYKRSRFVYDKTEKMLDKLDDVVTLCYEVMDETQDGMSLPRKVQRLVDLCETILRKVEPTADAKHDTLGDVEEYLVDNAPACYLKEDAEDYEEWML